VEGRKDHSAAEAQLKPQNTLNTRKENWEDVCFPRISVYSAVDPGWLGSAKSLKQID
jgi:hypothetical protein